jgi:hypothetical protein
MPHRTGTVESVPLLFWILVNCYWLTSLTLDFTMKETVAAQKVEVDSLNIKLKVSFCTASYILLLCEIPMLLVSKTNS